MAILYYLVSVTLTHGSTLQTVDLTSGIVNDQPIHLVDLFRTFVAAALDGGANYNFQNEVRMRGYTSRL